MPGTEPLHERRWAATHAIHKWSIEHPYAIIAFYTAVLTLAYLAIFRGVMPRRMMPYVEQPLIGVVTMMPGLSAEEMELYISKPIEEQLVNVENLRFIRSTSQDGFSIVTLEFHYGTDLDKALFETQTLMNVIQSFLPSTGANLKPSWVLKIDPLNLPILTLSLTGEGWDPVELRQFADNEVVNRLKQVKDVYSIVPYGGYRRQLQVIVDRQKLAAFGLSILDVRNALDQYNLSQAAGTVTAGGSEQIIRVDSRALDPATVENYPLTAVRGGQAPRPKASGGGGMGGMGGGSSEAAPAAAPRGDVGGTFTQHPEVIYIRDVARVVDTHWERRSAFHYLEHPPGSDGRVVASIGVEVIQNPSASSAQVVPRIERELRRLEQDYPGIAFAVAYDNAHFITLLFHNLVEELLVAALLTAIAIFFFLGEPRGTLIAVAVIPTSLAIAVLGVMPMGMSLNSGTLIGLLLSVGRVVDDTIVDIHAVERHLRLGKTVKDATIDGIGEVRLAVLASTFTIIVGLSPLLFCGGITEMMFVELVWPMIMALAASTLVSFTLTALLCANLLRPEAERERDLRFAPYRLVHQWLLIPFQRFLDRTERGYGRTIHWMLRHRGTNLARILATVILGFCFYNFIGSEMMPLADVGQAAGALEMQPGVSFEATEQAVFRIESMFLEYPEVEKVATKIGTETMFESFSPFFTGYAMPQANGAMMMLTLSDKDDRGRTIWDIIDAVQARAVAEIPGIRRFQIKEMGSDVMATALAPVSTIIYGPDFAVLEQLGKDTLRIAESMPDMFQPFISWELTKPTWRIDVDQARAAEVGLTPRSIAEQAYYAMRGGLTNEFYRLPNLRQNTILVRYEASDRASGQDLEDLYLTTADGRQVPLKTVAAVRLTRTPTLVERDNLRRVISVNGYYRIGHKPSMDVTMDLMMHSMGQLNYPPGYGMEARGDMTQMMDSFRRLLIGLQLAVLFIFLVLVAQFRGFIQPLQMVFSIPLELSGIFVALWLAHQAFSTVSIMGVIVVTGMDITAAILLVDLIVQYRDAGVPRDTAVRTACPQRLRPILMTAISTGVVMIPVAFAPKTGLDAYQPLGTTVLGGLFFGTILTLFDIPIMHTLVDDLIAWLERTFRRREHRWRQLRLLDESEHRFITEFGEQIGVPADLPPLEDGHEQ